MTTDFTANPNGDLLLSNEANPHLPRLNEYSPADLSLARQKSSAIARYEQIVSQQHNDFASQIRIDRHHSWMQGALATLCNQSTPREICLAWSLATDEIARRAWSHVGCDKLDLALFALGKWGSQELNLSSDIDIIVVSKEAPSESDYKCVREWISLLSTTTAFGFCFRVDTDLKPGGRLAPLICSLKQFEDYYWTSGETWEKLALVRLRAVAGNESLILDVTESVTKFIFRKHIDFSLLQDLKHLRAKIHSHYPQVSEDTKNLKLAPGGIRDIELFIHALQVIHGGKLKELRTTSTTEAALQLKSYERFAGEDLDYLIQTYWRFRGLENYVQALDDRQTHVWSKSEHGADEFHFFIQESLKVGQIVEHVLGQAQAGAAMPLDPAAQEEWLEKLGFNKETAPSRLQELLSLTALSTKTLQDEDVRLRVIRHFIEELSTVAIDKDLGFALLIDFFKAMRAKATFFSLLATETRLVRELSVLFGCSPYLGGILTSRPELIDSYLYRAQATYFDSFDQLLDALAERRLLNEIISASQFLQSHDLNQLLSELTLSADDICMSLLRSLKNEIGDSQVSIIALGKWGGGELGLRSDLDFIFVTPNEPSPIDQKICRRFLSRLTESHRGGAIYEVDIRLRPSGKGGPILVSRDQLLEYLTQSAATWERQTYLRARSLPEDSQFDRQIKSACTQHKLASSDLEELRSIHSQLQKPSADKIELKYGEGGLIDIEFASQISILLSGQPETATSTLGMISALAETDTLWRKQAHILSKNYLFLRTVEQLYQLVSQHPASQIDVNSDAFARISKLLNIESTSLEQKLRSHLYQNVEILKILDPRRSQK